MKISDSLYGRHFGYKGINNIQEVRTEVPAFIYYSTLFIQRFNSYPHSKPKSIFKDGFLGETRILTPACIKLFEYSFLLICHCLKQIIVMPRNIFHKLLHFW